MLSIQITEFKFHQYTNNYYYRRISNARQCFPLPMFSTICMAVITYGPLKLQLTGHVVNNPSLLYSLLLYKPLNMLHDTMFGNGHHKHLSQ